MIFHYILFAKAQISQKSRKIKFLLFINILYPKVVYFFFSIFKDLDFNEFDNNLNVNKF